MVSKFFRSATVFAFGMGLIVPSALLSVNSPFSIDQAFAEKGGNGGGRGNAGNNGGIHGGGNHANANGASRSFTEGAKTSPSANKSKGSIASKLGALNAAHASANALANASPNSRVGKIAAYRDAAVAEKTAAKVLEDATALATTTQDLANTAKSAYDKAVGDALAAAAAVTLAQNNVNVAAADTDLTNDAAFADALAKAQADATAANAAVTTKQTELTNALAAAALAQTALTTAETEAAAAAAKTTETLNAAANKTPVDAATQAALDLLLAGK